MAGVLVGVGTVGLAAFALRGLRSLKLTRTEMLNRASRESKQSAIERLEELAQEIIPMNIPVLEALARSKVDPFLRPGEAPQFDPDPVAWRESARKWLLALPPGTWGQIVDVLNRLEAWSTYFTTGVADPDVAFPAIAPLLRTWVGQYYPVLLDMRSDHTSGNFPNLILLNSAWTDKMTEEQLRALHGSMVTQIERHRSKMARGPKLPGPIGTELDE